MESDSSFFTQYKERIEQYVQNRLRLIQLQLTQKVAEVSSSITWWLLIAMLVFFLMISLSIMLGYYFAQLTGSVPLGFACLSGIYLIMLLLLFAFRKSIRTKVKDSVIQSMLDTKPETHESQRP
ncbi:MAG: phage holin family protein [Chitinophagia bacterium]